MQQRPVMWNQQLKLKPGLYQVRVAVRERDTARTGSAQQWIEVPDLSGGDLQMSSLFLGERKNTPADERFAAAKAVAVSVNHRFERASVMRFQTYVYNAAKGGAAPEVEIQARILRDRNVVMTLASARVPTDPTKDLTRLSYWSEISLDRLSAGRYELEVRATDRITKAAVLQTISFAIE